jgi:DNA-binding response OmpR family regulator
MKSRILLIDDDRSVTRLLSRVFLKHEFEVIVANNGPEGIQLAREQGPEAIILDLSLPQLNGWQVCREIRRFSNAPIVIYSGNTDPHTRDSILAEGANYFLAKPAPLNELVAAVQGAVG